MADYVFDVVAFREAYPAFSNVTTYPEAALQRYWNNGNCYIANCNYGYLRGDCRLQALNLMTAHLAQLATIIDNGQNGGDVPGMAQSAAISQVNVSLTPPPFATSQWRWWLNLTGYGQSLLALLSLKAAGGFYIGGSPERLAFRGVGWRCGRGWRW